MKNINRTLLFLTLTFAINFSMVGLFLLFGGKLQSLSGMALAAVYMFVPMLSAILVEKGIHKEKIIETLQISFSLNKWFLVAWLITPLMAFAAFGVSLLFPDVNYTPEMTGLIKRFEGILTPDQLEQTKRGMEALLIHPIWIIVFQGLVAGLTVNAIAGFGEELGWRGFLLKQFENMSFGKASLVIGFIWGIWHAPLILLGHNYPQHPEIGVLMMVVFCVLLSPLFNYITLKSRSVIAAAIMHGTLNGTAGLAIMLIDGGTDLTVGVTGLAGFIVLGMLLSVIFVYDNWISKEKIMQSKIEKFLGKKDSDRGVGAVAFARENEAFETIK